MNYEEKLEEDAIDVARPEREISLGTSTILGIFLGLALICAVCFGLGYTMGHRSSPVTASSVPVVAPSPKADSAFSSFKQPANAPKAAAPAPEPAAATDDAAATPAVDAPSAAPSGQPAISANGTWMVQVSLSSVKPDADKLTGVLVRQGFPASMREDKDRRFHIRVGPFASKADADTTRKALVAAGYKEPFISNR